MSCLKGVRGPVKAPRGRWDFSRDVAAPSTSSHVEENLLIFSRLGQDTWGFPLLTTGTSGTLSCSLRKVQSPCDLREFSPDSSPVGAGSLGHHLGLSLEPGLLSSDDMDPPRFLWSVNRVKLRLVCRHTTLLSSHAVTVVSTSC